MTDDKLLDSYPWKGGLDLLNIVLICIANEFPDYDEKYELHRLLSTLLSMELTATEKFILNMHRKGYTLEQIAECAEKTIEEVEAVIKKREPVLA